MIPIYLALVLALAAHVPAAAQTGAAVVSTDTILVTADKPVARIDSTHRLQNERFDRQRMVNDDVLEAVALKAGIVKQGGEMKL